MKLQKNKFYPVFIWLAILLASIALSIFFVWMTAEKLTFSDVVIRSAILFSWVFTFKMFLSFLKYTLYNKKEKYLFLTWLKWSFFYGLLTFDICNVSFIVIFIQFILKIDIFRSGLPLVLYKVLFFPGLLIGNIGFVGILIKEKKVKFSKQTIYEYIKQAPAVWRSVYSKFKIIYNRARNKKKI
jgi:hypothetical protein